jgi:hypothetical protein
LVLQLAKANKFAKAVGGVKEAWYQGFHSISFPTDWENRIWERWYFRCREILNRKKHEVARMVWE